MERAMVTNIQGYSIHDGPGIRTVVFLKGCPLRCAWCANPENLAPRSEVGFIRRLCQGCGRCLKACPSGAILPGDGYRIDKAKCRRCGACAERCYYGALVRYGEERTSGDVFEEVRKDKMFYDASGGGVTVSGGEPLLYPEFVFELFTLCRGAGISTCVETCGCVSQEAVERVLPVTDLLLYDLKIMDPELHKAHTGADNGRILDNARYLAERGANILFRQPLIPGCTDSEENIRRTAEFIKSLDRPLSLELMPFHRAGKSKYEALGLFYAVADLSPLTPEEIAAVRDKYESLGVSCSVSA